MLVDPEYRRHLNRFIIITIVRNVAKLLGSIVLIIFNGCKTATCVYKSVKQFTY